MPRDSHAEICTPRQRFGAVLGGGKEGPTNSHISGLRLELHWGVLRRLCRGWTPTSRSSTAAVRGPLDGSGLLSIDKKGERNHSFLSPRHETVLPSKKSHRRTVARQGGRYSEKGARGPARVRVPSGIMPQGALIVGPLNYEPARLRPTRCHKRPGAWWMRFRGRASTGAVLTAAYAVARKKPSHGPPWGWGTPGGVSRVV